MKKILLTTAAALVLSSATAYAAEGDFFVKANGGWSKLNDQKVTSSGNQNDKLKASNSGFVGAGVGYYLMDNVRADVTFDHLFDPEFKVTKKMEAAKIEGQTVEGGDLTVKGKAQINTLMVNGYVDLFDLSIAKFFAGAGVGASMSSSKYTYTMKGMKDESVKFKKTNGVAFAGYLGASAEVAPGIHAELAYSYRSFGKPGKEPKDTTIKALQGHHVGAGIRFDI